MNLTNLEKYGRLIVPGATKQKITQTNMRLILSNGAHDIAYKAECIHTSQDFSSVANTDKYSLDTNLTRYLKMAKAGVWWHDGTRWEQLDPVTEQYMKLNYPNWQNDAAGTNVERYWYEEDNLYIHPKLSSAGSNDIRVYFYQAPAEMTSGSHYPFGGSAEVARLRILHETLIKYWKWKAYEILAKPETARAEKVYEDEVERVKKLLKDKQDVKAGSYSYLTKMRGPKIGGR